MSVSSVHHLVERWVQWRPDACAVREPFSRETLTYQQLWQRSGWLAGDLVSRGVRPSDLVAVGMGRSVDLVVALLGIVRAGAAYLPLDDHAPAERLSAILDEANTDLVVCSSGQHRNGTGEPWRDLPPHHRRVPVSAPAAALPPPEVMAGGDDPLYVAYTSGSTGRPKGVVVPHRAVIRLVVAPKFCTIVPGDRVAQSVQPRFRRDHLRDLEHADGGRDHRGVSFGHRPHRGQVGGVGAHRARSRRCSSPRRCSTWWRGKSRRRCTRCAPSWSAASRWISPRARRVLATGAPRRLVNGYGPTETTTFATLLRLHHRESGRPRNRAHRLRAPGHPAARARRAPPASGSGRAGRAMCRRTGCRDRIPAPRGGDRGEVRPEPSSLAAPGSLMYRTGDARSSASRRRVGAVRQARPAGQAARLPYRAGGDRKSRRGDRPGRPACSSRRSATARRRPWSGSCYRRDQFHSAPKNCLPRSLWSSRKGCQPT